MKQTEEFAQLPLELETFHEFEDAYQGRWTYSICVIEGYSRKILAGMASEYQDELAILQLLHAALSEFNCSFDRSRSRSNMEAYPQCRQ